MKLPTLARRAQQFLLAAVLALAGLSPALAQSLPVISVADIRMMEGNAPGERQMEFVVTLSQPSDGSQGFHATTEFSSSPSAKPGSDYVSTVVDDYRFPVGATTATVVVPILSDTTIEPNEYFIFHVYRGRNVEFGKTEGIGQILNDDGTILASVGYRADTVSTQQSTGGSSPHISGNGRYVAFMSESWGVVPDTSNHYYPYVYLRDTIAGTNAHVNKPPLFSGINGTSANPRVSNDGRYVVYQSDATTLVASDPNGTVTDIFVRDMISGTTTLVSIPASGGAGANGPSTFPAISADGKRIAFMSTASNLVASDPNGAGTDVFVRDLNTGVTTLVSVSGSGTTSGGDSPDISADGRYVAFNSSQPLVAGDLAYHDVYRRDLATGALERVSVGAAGAPNGDSFGPSLSGDGSRVAFTSNATNLASGDNNNGFDVFVRDVVAGTTVVASLDSSGNYFFGGVACSICPMPNSAISGDGNTVAFVTRWAAVPGDNNSTEDVYLRNVSAATTTRASRGVTSSSNGGGQDPSLSDDGQLAAFTSSESDLVLGDAMFQDVFVSGRPGTLSSNVTLSGLTTDLGALTPAFSPDVRAYSQTTGAYSARFTVTTVDLNATITINGTPAQRGVPSTPLSLASGQNVFDIVVTAHDGVTQQHTTVTITRDSVEQPILTITNVGIAEGNSGSKEMTFTATLDKVWTSDVTFSVSTSDGTAVAGSDYATMIYGSAYVPAGKLGTTIRVTVYGDGVAEADEFFNLNITNVVNGTAASAQARGTILSDDAGGLPYLSVVSRDMYEGNSGTRELLFHVVLSAPSPNPVTFDIRTQEIYATAGVDFIDKAEYGRTIPAGVTEAAFPVTILGDAVDEDDEKFFVTLANVTGAGADTMGFGEILNDDSGPGEPPLLYFDHVTVAEGGTGTKQVMVTARLSKAIDQDVTYALMTEDYTAVSATDYVSSTWNFEKIPAGETSKTFMVTIKGDKVVESEERFYYRVWNPVNAVARNGWITIRDDDAPCYRVYLEGKLRLICDGAPQAATVDSGGEVRSRKPFVGKATDVDGEAVRNVDKPAQPALSVADAYIAEGRLGQKQLSFTVSLSARASRAVSFRIDTADGTAVAGTDYVGKSQRSLTIAAGSLSKTFTVAIKGDTVVEPSETFTVRLSAVTGAAVADGQATGTIANDDAVPLSIARLETGGLYDDIDDGNRAPLLSTGEYALLLADAARNICGRAGGPTVVAVDGVENQAVLGDLAEAASLLCGRDYSAVRGTETDQLGFLVHGAAKTVQVLGTSMIGESARSLTLTAEGHAAPVRVLLATSGSTNPAASQAAAFARQVRDLAAANQRERFVLLGASAQAARALSGVLVQAVPARPYLRARAVERVLLSPAVRDARIEAVVTKSAAIDPAVLHLQH